MHAYNYAAVAESSYPQVVRDVAAKLSHVDYLDVGTFLADLPQRDLEDLVGRSTRVTMGVDAPEDFDCLIIVGGMLAQAEGVSLELDDTASRTSNFMILLSFEDLARKGVIEFFREKATLGTEELDQTIARLK